MTDTDNDADRRFVHNLFSGGSNDNSEAGDKKDQGTGEYTEEQRQWVRGLFADDEDEDVLPGLKSGKTIGIWRHPEPEPDDKGPWYDRRPIIDD
jgi:hypothetical protein